MSLGRHRIIHVIDRDEIPYLLMEWKTNSAVCILQKHRTCSKQTSLVMLCCYCANTLLVKCALEYASYGFVSTIKTTIDGNWVSSCGKCMVYKILICAQIYCLHTLVPTMCDRHEVIQLMTPTIPYNFAITKMVKLTRVGDNYASISSVACRQKTPQSLCSSSFETNQQRN